MGKRARLKKEMKLSQAAEERLAMESRRRQARQPIMRLVRRVAIALTVTIIILYVGQAIDRKIVTSNNGTTQQ